MRVPFPVRVRGFQRPLAGGGEAYDCVPMQGSGTFAVEAMIGSFVPREYMFDMYLAFAFGILGYLARKTGYHVAAILIGVILGPLLERYMLVALQKSDGDFLTLFSSTLGNILWLALVASLVLPVFMKHRQRRRESVFAEGEG